MGTLVGHRKNIRQLIIPTHPKISTFLNMKQPVSMLPPHNLLDQQRAQINKLMDQLTALQLRTDKLRVSNRILLGKMNTYPLLLKPSSSRTITLPID